MKIRTDKTQDNEPNSVADKLAGRQNLEATVRFLDNRPEAVAQRRLETIANHSQRVKQLQAYQAIANDRLPHTVHRKGNVEKKDPLGVQATTQMKRGVAVNDEPALELEADVMGARALQMKSGQEEPGDVNTYCLSNGGVAQPIQRMELFHGTTIEHAEEIETEIDPSKGKGEFGAGYYTVFDKAQAQHISQYYWNKETKWTKGQSGVAVVRTNMDDEHWDELIGEGVGEDRAVYLKHNRWVRDRLVAEGELPAEPQIKLPSGEQVIEDWAFREGEEKEEPLSHSVVIGPIKDPQTPYLQVVFDMNIKGWLNENSERETIWQSEEDGTIVEIETDEAFAGLGSMTIDRGSEEAIAFFKRDAKGDGANTEAKRMNILSKYFGGYQDSDIDDSVSEWIKTEGGAAYEGRDHGDVIYKYIQSGLV